MTTPVHLSLPREVPVAKRRAPPVPREVKDRAKASLAHWVGVAQQTFKRPVPMPTISFDLVGTAAGKAIHDIRHVQLNAVLLTENLESFESDTIPHELAHILAGPGFGHGPVWQAIMRKLGLEPERTHDLDTTNSRTTALIAGYACECGSHPLSERKHQKVARGRAVYTCKKCRKPIRWVGDTPSKPVRPASPAYPAQSSRLGPQPRPAATQHTSRPPSEAMLRFASSLAKKHGFALPRAVEADFELCKQLLDKWAKAPTAAPTPAPRSAAVPPPRPTVAPAPVSTFPDGPTDKQLAYAKSIAARKKLDIPAAALRSKREISAWIDQNK